MEKYVRFPIESIGRVVYGDVSLFAELQDLARNYYIFHSRRFNYNFFHLEFEQIETWVLFNDFKTCYVRLPVADAHKLADELTNSKIKLTWNYKPPEIEKRFPWPTYSKQTLSI